METSIEMIELYKREFLLNKACYNSQPHMIGHKKRYVHTHTHTHTHKEGLNNITQTPQLGTPQAKQQQP
jgi:hypothetical protein